MKKTKKENTNTEMMITMTRPLLMRNMVMDQKKRLKEGKKVTKKMTKKKKKMMKEKRK